MKYIAFVLTSILLFAGCDDEKPKMVKYLVDKTCNQGRFVDVSDYGAVADDDMDDYEAVTRAVEEINRLKGGTLIFHKGVYTVKGHKIAASNQVPENDIKNFVFKDCSCLTIEGGGAVLDIDGNWSRVADYEQAGFTYSLHNSVGMEFENCKDVNIKNLELDGNSDQTLKEATAEGKSHGLIISGCNNVTIQNSYIHHFQADGLYLNSRIDVNRYIQSRYLNIKDSNFTNNARNGVSIIQARDVNFTNCLFSQSGKTGLYGGHSPQAGVNVEPNYWVQTGVNDNTGDLFFKNCTFSDNTGFEYVGSNDYTTPYPIRFDNCTFKNTVADLNNSKYAAVVPASAITYFDSCIFDEVALRPNYAGKKEAFVDVNLFDSSFKSTLSFVSVLFSVGYPNVKMHIERCSFDFNATSPAIGKYRFYLRNAKTILEDNEIFISRLEHNAQGEDIKFLLEKGINSFANHWKTDLNQTGSYFTVSYVESNSSYDTYTPKKSFEQRY